MNSKRRVARLGETLLSNQDLRLNDAALYHRSERDTMARRDNVVST
jgi:hypothetical protein